MTKVAPFQTAPDQTTAVHCSPQQLPSPSASIGTYHHFWSGAIVLCSSDPSSAPSSTASGSPSRAREVAKVNLQLGCDVIGGFPEDMRFILYHLKQSQAQMGTRTAIYTDIARTLSIFNVLHSGLGRPGYVLALSPWAGQTGLIQAKP